MSPSQISRTRTVCGIDVGGANIKAAVASSEMGAEAAIVPSLKDRASTLPCALWNEHQLLEEKILECIQLICDPSSLHEVALSMTGELADCYSARKEGVTHIIQNVASALGDAQVSVYSVDGEWLTPGEAKSRTWDVAASNWHALANWLGQQERLLASPFLLVDIGSTTCDIIPVCQGIVATNARTDRQRLESLQLVYTGYERTPIAAIRPNFTLDGKTVPTMAERFADSVDAYLALSLQAEEPENFDTADGRPRTKRFAEARLARMIGEDTDRICAEDLQLMAQQVIDAQVASIVQAVTQNAEQTGKFERINRVVFTGHANALKTKVRESLSQSAEWRFLDLDSLLPKALPALVREELNRCAPALALARLRMLHVDQTQT